MDKLNYNVSASEISSVGESDGNIPDGNILIVAETLEDQPHENQKGD